MTSFLNDKRHGYACLYYIQKERGAAGAPFFLKLSTS
jgi:hypothetical protein